jgi:hypothetical protein
LHFAPVYDDDDDDVQKDNFAGPELDDSIASWSKVQNQLDDIRGEVLCCAEFKQNSLCNSLTLTSCFNSTFSFSS